jgi:hypothetical protein
MPSDRFESATEFAEAAIDSITTAAPAPAAPPIDADGATQLLDTGPTDQEVTAQLKNTRLSEAPATIAIGDIDAAEGETDPAPVAQDTDSPEQATTPATPMPHTMPEAPKKKKPIMAIAASVVVIGIGGGVAAVALGGGGDSSLSNDSTQIALGTPPDSGIRDDTPAAGGNVTSPGGSQGQTDPVTQQGPDSESAAESTAAVVVDDPVVPPPPTVDSAAIDDELFSIFEGLEDPARRPALMERAQALFRNNAIPPYLRGQAAYMVATGYIEDNDLDNTCRWLNHALEMDDINSTYLAARTSAGCN